MLKKFFFLYLWIAILVSILVACTDHEVIPKNGTWNVLELRMLDFMFHFKPQPKENAAKDVCLITIDEESYKFINQPLIFYHTYISSVIGYLVKAKAKVIGLDIQLPSISLEGRVSGGYDSVYAQAFLDARKKGVDVVMGFSPGQNVPLRTYLLAAGRDNLSMLSLTQDKDDFIRRQQLWFEDSKTKYDSFPYLLAKKFTGKNLSPPGRTILIDYSLAGDIQTYPFYEIYRLSQEDKVREDFFKGKAVIIGTLFAYEDRHATPLYHYPSDKGKRTPGIIIQAASLATVLSGRFFHEPGPVTGSFYIFLASLLAVFLCFNRRPLPAAVLCIIEAVAILLIAIVAFNQYYLMRIIPLYSSVLVSFGATTVFHYYTEERNKIKIRNRFASYVPENIIEKIVNTDIGRLTEGEQKELVLFFSDIRGFTTYSEKNKGEPKKVENFLNQYHKEMTDIILANNGTVAQLTGDGIFAFFGAPVEISEPVFAAVRSAVQMRERIAELKPKWLEFGMDDLRIGVGIHVGDSIVGNIGSVKKMAYVAIGDNTNIASRIEGLTKEFNETVLISEAAYNQVRDKVIARSLGQAKIKGHSEITIFALDGLLDPEFH